MSAPRVQQTIGSVSFVLKQVHDFTWLQEMGTPFAVFDQQDSGNICFGVEVDGERTFVKYAGAQTIDYAGSAADAVDRLRRVVKVYADLRHENLVALRQSRETREGFAVVFDWCDGECLHPHWQYPPPAKYTDPRSPFCRFRQLPVEDRARAVGDIIDFHEHVERRGYVAVDFYDGSILYDFSRASVKVCDIDCYERRPFRNTMGRLWGSSRFMSPEEFEQGAAIDERTNVFGMGATAFCLLGGERDRSIEKWEAGEALFSVARRAVSPKREDRYATVAELHQAWERCT